MNELLKLLCVSSQSVCIEWVVEQRRRREGQSIGIAGKKGEREEKAEEKVGGGIGFETLCVWGWVAVRERLWGIWLKTVQLKNR